jgi:hypothetical protein
MHVIPETIHGQYITYVNLHAHNFTKRTSLSPKSSLTPPLIIEMLVTSQGSKRSHICVLGGIHFASFYDFDILFWIWSDSVVLLLFFHFIIILIVT